MSYQLFSVTEAARLLGRSRFFVYDEIMRGRLAVHKLGGKFAISQADLDAYISRSRTAALGERRAVRKPKEVAS